MVKIADFIEAPNSGGDWTKVLLVVHVTVSPETKGAARGIVAYWNRARTGSTQYVVDAAEIIQAVRETAYPWAAGTTANRWGIHVEHCGYIQTLRQWRDGYSTAELELSAPLFAELAAKYGIPIRRLTPAQIRHAVKTGNPADGGICGHADITKAFPGETTHSDPGKFFPWRRFMDLVKAAAKTPAPAPTPPPPAPKAGLRVATSNVWVKLNPKQASSVVDEVLAAKPQIVGLQEWSRGRRKILRKNGPAMVFPGAQKVLRRWHLAEKYPTAGVVFGYPPIGGQPIGVDSEYGEIIAVRQIELAKRRKKVRATKGTEALIRVKATGALVPVLNLHLLAHHNDPAHKAGWEEGRRAAIDWAESWAGYDCIVMGDTNKDLMDLDGLISCWDGHPQPGTFKGRSIDNIYGRLKAADAFTIRTRSDHDTAVADYPEET